VTLYADSSALLKRCVDEPGSEAVDLLLRSDPVLVTGRHDARQAQAARSLGMTVVGA